MRYGAKQPSDSDFYNAEVALNELLGFSVSGTGGATVTSVSDSDSSQQLVASNTDRKGLIIVNDSSQILYIKFGGAAGTTDYSIRLVPFGTYEMGYPKYLGAIHGIWAANGSGSARITEFA